MSILAASESGPPLWAWSVWLVAAVAVGVVAMLRPRRIVAGAAETVALDGRILDYARPTERSLQFVPLLAITGLMSFFAWVATQLLYVSVRRHAIEAAGGTLTNATQDLVRLSFLSALVGWAVGIGFLIYGGGVKAVGMSPKRVPSGALAGAIGIFVALPIVYFALRATLLLWKVLHFEHPAKHQLLEAIDADPNRWVKIVAVVSAAVIAPLFEELLFRGCVQNGLRRATGSPWVAIAVASVLFASIHPMWTILPIFVFSLLLGVVYERTRNLWAVIFMHALFNAFSLINSGLN